jgi:hypothetical protein
MKRLKVLVGCEESGEVRRAFRALGHAAYSCDLLPARDGSLHHYQGDIFEFMKKESDWDLGIFFPPCTNLCVSGARWFKQKRESGEQQKSVEFFLRLAGCGIEHTAIENPIGIMSSLYGKPDQIIQPWQFGHGETKATCLWLKNLPKLTPTNIVSGREARIHKMAPGPERSRERSKTYSGIARAMAEQWSAYLTQS